MEFLRSLVDSEGGSASTTTGQFHVKARGGRLHLRIQLQATVEPRQRATIQAQWSSLFNRHFPAVVRAVPYFDFRDALSVDYERKFQHKVQSDDEHLDSCTVSESTPRTPETDSYVGDIPTRLATKVVRELSAIDPLRALSRSRQNGPASSGRCPLSARSASESFSRSSSRGSAPDNTPAIVMHQGTHYLLFKNRRLNAVVSELFRRGRSHHHAHLPWRRFRPSSPRQY